MFRVIKNHFLAIKKNTSLLLLVLLMFLSTLALAKCWLVGDGVAYYAWLRSLLWDHDINFFNEFTTLNFTKSAFVLNPLPETQLTPNTFSIGPSIVWAVVIIPLKICFSLLGDGNATGFDGRYIVPISLISLSVGYIGLLSCFALVKRIVPTKIAVLTVLAIWWATPLPQYLYDEMNYSHVFSFTAVALFLLHWTQTKMKVATTKDALWFGFLAGIATLMRWQESILLLLPVCAIFYDGYKQKKWKYLQIIFPLFLTFSITIFPQILAWKMLYGNWFVLPQGPGFFYFTSLLSENRLLNFLFSPLHGLFYSHPVFGIALLGSIFLYKRNKRLAVSCLFFLCMQIIINASVADWWAGHSFGARRMIDTLPILALFLASLIERYQQWRLTPYTLTAILIGLNSLYWLQYRTMLDHGIAISWLSILSFWQKIPWQIVSLIKQSTFIVFLQSNPLKALVYAIVLLAITTMVTYCSGTLLKKRNLR